MELFTALSLNQTATPHHLPLSLWLSCLATPALVLILLRLAEPEVRHWILDPPPPPGLTLLGLSLVLSMGITLGLCLSSDWPAWLVCSFVSLLVALTLVDLRCRLLPDRLTLSLGLLGLSMALGPEFGLTAPLGLPEWHMALLGAGLGYGLPLLLLRLQSRQSPGMGRGDLALMAGLGVWLGPLGLFWAVFMASLLMLPVLAFGLIWRGWKRDTPLPFGPALAAGGLLQAGLQCSL